MATRLVYSKIPDNLRAKKTIVLDAKSPYGRAIAAMDSIMPTVTNIKTILPTVQGAASENLRVYKATREVGNVIDFISTVDAALDDPDSEVSNYAKEVVADPRFLKFLVNTLEGVVAEVKAAHGLPADPAKAAANAGAATPAAAPKANATGAASPATENDPAANLTQEEIDALPNGPDYSEIKSRGADGMPPTAPNSFTPQHLERALEVRNFAPYFHLSKNPHVGMDAARQAVSQMQFVPAWDSNVWTDAARADYRARAITNGEIARHLAQFGVAPMDNKGKTLPIPIWNMPDGPIRRYFENE